ncbi:hypothetical protein GMORB2_0365 [Geosmithia morbida]|uniref:Uncharacterized protein n=1 Tax=Geosmithia morbida TaxID=1094350 RepID=A0A9P4Z4Q7_9HYPO|nr:uncharacterized protein GMORB2_0365 [Geosmithia morbida]KAF4126629.1 hypothetical protein GMORB2_0365 [Geosmithia morbida]
METNSDFVSAGGLTNVTGKLYPRRLRPWVGFEQMLEREFSHLEQTFGQNRIFPSSTELNLAVSDISGVKIARENGLANFEKTVVVNRVRNIFEPYARIAAESSGTSSPQSMRDISFAYDPFGVVATESDEDDEEEEDDRPAYLGALAIAQADMERAAKAEAEAEAEGHDPSGRPRKRKSPLRTTIDSSALRKLLGSETDETSSDASISLMEDATRLALSPRVVSDEERPKISIGMIMTQAYDYMVEYGLQYSYLATGPAFIFLFLDPDEPTTVYYRLEEPGVSANSNSRDGIKHSAVSLAVAFVLMSIKGQYMSQKWKRTMQETLPTWPTPFDDMEIGPGSDASGERRDDTNVLTETPDLHPESRDGNSESCGDPQKFATRCREDEGDDDKDPDQTFRPPSAKRASGSESRPDMTLVSRVTRSSAKKSASPAISSNDAGNDRSEAPSAWTIDTFCSGVYQSPKQPYCTQACLLGLKTGGSVDPDCPNTPLHTSATPASEDGNGSENSDAGNDEKRQRHPISVQEFRKKLMEQLARDMDRDCDNLERYGMYGAIGAIFKIALSRYGYCFVAKGVQNAHRKRLEKELAAYSVLESCQGRLVPVNLGVVVLVHEYHTLYGAHISHMMLMSYCGQSLWSRTRDTGEHDVHRREMADAFQELRSFGLEHCDENRANSAQSGRLETQMSLSWGHQGFRSPEEYTVFVHPRTDG